MAKKGYKDIMQIIIDYCKDKGYTIYNLEQDEHCKNYFSYKIKELGKHWCFGTYIYNKTDKTVKYEDNFLCDECKQKHYPNNDDYIQVQIFTQYDRDIDKFKFSRSFYKTELCFYDIKEYIKDADKQYNFLFEINDMLTEIKKHPWVARCYSGCYIEPSYTTPFKAWQVCMKWDIQEDYHKFQNLLNHWHIIMALKWYKLTRKVINYKIIDRNFDDIVCYPRWNVEIRVKSKYADDIDEKLEKIANKHDNDVFTHGHSIYTYDDLQESQGDSKWI